MTDITATCVSKWALKLFMSNKLGIEGVERITGDPITKMVGTTMLSTQLYSHGVMYMKEEHGIHGKTSTVVTIEPSDSVKGRYWLGRISPNGSVIEEAADYVHGADAVVHEYIL